MVLPTPLQRLRDLDKSSPQFHDQLSDALRRKEYRNCVSNLRSEDLVWLVEYLDRVSPIHHWPLSTHYRRRF